MVTGCRTGRLSTVLEAVNKNGGVHVEPTTGNMNFSCQFTQVHLVSSPMAVDDSRRFLVGLISNDFDVNEF